MPEEAELRTLITGKATMLESQFRLRYNMIVNLLRVEDLSVEDMLKRSFAELQAQRAMKGHADLLTSANKLLKRINALAAAHKGQCLPNVHSMCTQFLINVHSIFTQCALNLVCFACVY
jgi:superfamily II RNA helicase